MEGIYKEPKLVERTYKSICTCGWSNEGLFVSHSTCRCRCSCALGFSKRFGTVSGHLPVVGLEEINCTFKKKLTYGPNDARCVVWALFHLCFIFVGLHWPLLTDVGLRGRRPGQLRMWWVRNKLYIQKKTHLWPKRR